MKNLGIVSVLYFIFNFAFWVSIAFLIFNLSLLVFTHDGSVGNFSTDLHPSKGFQIPVKMYIRTPDSIFDWKGERPSKRIDKDIYSINKIPAETSFEILSKFKNETLQLTQNHVSVNTKVRVKSSNMLFGIFGYFYNYLSLVVAVISFYLLKRIFQILRRRITFSSALFENIRNLGFLFIFSQICYVVLSVYFATNYGVIRFILADDPNVNQLVEYIFNPTLDFNFVFFIMGLSLIILSVLLRYGQSIREDNDLTI
ncbi:MULTISPECIES: DUF2975 domain-containing protein [Aequorivita]|uniref:DUF2975 domain-containing protein n=2 Tax=Aequorivita TaxID=153265 RepID=A0AB35YPA6_9FLAO|nr:DUF2975 domain-containing protein [Aequorivita sp. Ant34-E75]WGF93289.1 DUF2975 domain-containing protein [Aequorivita sp. Ant34-E75]